MQRYPDKMPLMGKTYWLRQQFPQNPLIDLLKSDVFADFATRPSLLRERMEHFSSKGPIIIDEIQKIPALLNEVHWLIENKNLSFILTGSSSRKLHRGQANLLGGRAWKRVMLPLSIQEVDELDLEKIMISGLLPPHFLSPDPIEDLRGYVSDYFKEEIAAEAAVKNIPAFADFLRVAALSNSELINYTNMASETGVSAKVIRNYIEILEDTYLGFRVRPWKKSKSRRMILTEKFYFFDVGVSNYLAKRQPRLGSAEFGKAFEHYILMELKAYQAYRNPEMEISFWRTSTDLEVDFILGEMEMAIEVKTARRLRESDLSPLKALMEESKIKRCLIVSLEEERRTLNTNHGKIEIWPWRSFLSSLWNSEFSV